MSETDSIAAPQSADHAQFKREGDYVRIPGELAERHRLYGVKGWTVVLGVFLSLDAVASIISLFLLLAAIGDGGPWVALFALVHAGLAVWLIACVSKLFGKDPGFPSHFMAFCAASATYVVLIAMLGGGSWVTAVQLVVTALYAGYARNSRRVRVTYRHEVEPRDPLLADVFPGGLPAHLEPAPAEPVESPMAVLDRVRRARHTAL